MYTFQDGQIETLKNDVKEKDKQINAKDTELQSILVGIIN